MATVAITMGKLARGVHTAIWTGLSETDADGAWFGGDEGAPFLPDKTMHVYGTWGGGTLIIEGTNKTVADATNNIVLTDVHANAASYTADSIDALAESPRHLRPRVTAGTGVSLTVIIVAYAVRPPR